MDFRPAHERVQAERDRRFVDFWGVLSAQDRQRFLVLLVIFSIAAALVGILAAHGLWWAVPAYLALAFVSGVYQFIRRPRQGQ